MEKFAKHWLLQTLPIAVAGSLSMAPLNAVAAGLQIHLMSNGKPMANAPVSINDKVLGRTDNGGVLWLDDLTQGRQSINVKLNNQNYPLRMSLNDDEAAFVQIQQTSDQGILHQVNKVALAKVEVIDTKRGNKMAVLKDESDQVIAGRFAGQVMVAGSSQPIVGAKIRVVGQPTQAFTDAAGQFNLQLPPGHYQLQVQHPDYQMQNLPMQSVLSKTTTQLTIQMHSQSQMEEVQVTASYLGDTAISTERMANALVDGVDFTQIARFDDSMVSTALKRVVGVSLENDRYAVVRGMKSRYQSVFFNGTILPATDPARRDLPLDIFPANIMQSLSLQKTATANVPATATAGHMEMKTREIPDQSFVKISASIAHGDMHGDQVLRSSTEGDDDWLGKDDGRRDLPQALSEIRGEFWVPPDSDLTDYNGRFNEAQVEALGESLIPNHQAIVYGDAIADITLDAAAAKRWQLGGQQSFGVLGALRYANKWDDNTKTNFIFKPAPDPDQPGAFRPIPSTLGDTRDTNNIIDISGVLNFELQLSPQHSLHWNNIYLRHTTDSAELRRTFEGTGYVTPELALTVDDFYLSPQADVQLNQRTDWIEEQLFSRQLAGEHRFITGGDYLNEVLVDWSLSTASTEYERPNATNYMYVSRQLGSDFTLQNIGRASYLLWEAMEEDNLTRKLDVKLPFADIYGAYIDIKAGYLDLDRERSGNYYQYHFAGEVLSETGESGYASNPDPREIFVEEVITGTNSGTGLVLNVSRTHPDDDVGIKGDLYVVEQESDAKYLMADILYKDQFNLNFGVRQESFYLGAEVYDYNPEDLITLIDEQESLPSVGLTWFFNTDWQLRAAYSETVSWPEIFEILPRSFRNLETLEVYRGNPDLKHATIKNYDSRLEWYPSDNETVTFAVFYKKMSAAIENIFQGQGDDFSYYSFANVDSAEVRGWELDLRKEYTLDNAQAHQMFIQFNYTDIDSEVDFERGDSYRDPDRPLQGQPEYITNLQLGYDHIPTAQEITLAFNRKGRELVVVSDGGVPGVYQQAYNDLKLVYKKSFFNGLSLSFSIDNLLNETRSLEYDEYQLPYLQYEEGRRFKAKVSYQY